MKIIKLIYVLLLVAGGLKAQIGHNYFHFEEFTHGDWVASTNDHIFIEKRVGTNFDHISDQCMLLKLDMDLKVIDSLNLNSLFNQSFNNIVIASFKLDRDSNLILAINLGSYGSNNCYYNDLKVIRLNQNLTILDSISVSSTIDTSSFYAYNIKVYEDELLIAGAIFPYCFISDTLEGFVVKLDYDLQFQSEFRLFANQLLNGKPAYFSDVSKYGNKILVALGGLHWLRDLVVLDDSLNFISFRNLNPSVDFQNFGLLNILESPSHSPKIFSIGGSQKFAPPQPDKIGQYRYLGLTSLDSNFISTKLDTFSFTWDNYYFAESAIPKSNVGNISLDNSHQNATFFGDDVYPWPGNYPIKYATNTYIYNVNIDNMQVNWHRVYNNGYSRKTNKVIQLPDGRWLISMNEYNWDKYNYQNMSILLLVLDNQGNPIGIPEEQQFTQNPSIYPNPVVSGGVVNISGLSDGKTYNYYLNNATGQTVQRGVVAGQESMQLQQLPTGVYTLSITNTYGWGWATKLVVE